MLLIETKRYEICMIGGNCVHLLNIFYDLTLISLIELGAKGGEKRESDVMLGKRSF